jgi:uncharacterized protein involved in response to NO
MVRQEREQQCALAAGKAPAARSTRIVSRHGLCAQKSGGMVFETTREPILLVLHIGYLWLVVSLALLGLSALTPSHFVPSTALHALTAGAIGTMTLAVMTRASLGHTGREIKAGGATLAIYALVTIGALLRVAAPLLPGGYLNVLTLSGILWSAAFALFVLSYGPILLRPGAGRI